MASSTVYQEIAARAYQLFEARGKQPGRDQDDWLQAEREVLSRNGAKRTTGGGPKDRGARGGQSRSAY